MDRYEVDNPQKSEEIKAKTRETNYVRYGGAAPACSKEVLDKMEATCEERYGVSNFSKSPLFAAFHRKRIFYDGLYFDSNWEVKVYDYLKENHIPFEYSPSNSLPYEYDGREFTYHPDFLVDGILYEVKGDQFFRINESTGQEEMFNPYRDEDWSDERYDWECGKYEEKHQCMLRNNVIILRESQIENLDPVFNYVKHTAIEI